MTNDLVFRLVFTKYPELLKQLIAALLEISYESIKQFEITSRDITPEEIGKKTCTLDIKMIVDDKHLNLEVQVEDEKNYVERSLYYWARMFSKALNEGVDYATSPRTIVISILGFNLFRGGKKYFSEFKLLDVESHNLLTDRCALHYYELCKLPKSLNIDNRKEMWLNLFNAKTEEEIANLDSLGVPIMSEAIYAFRQVSTSKELEDIEWLREKSVRDEAWRTGNAVRERDEHWQGVVTDLRAVKDAELAKKDAELAKKDAELAELKARLNENES